MAFTFLEKPNSRQQSLAGPTLTLMYTAAGSNDDLFVGSEARSSTPAVTYIESGKVYREDVILDWVGHELCDVTVVYGPRQRETGSYSFTFDTTGGTAKVTCAREHIASYPPSDDNNPHRGAIGVDKDGNVEGVEITIPALKYTFTFRQPRGVVTIPYTKLLAAYTGAFNSKTFLTFSPGELLFMGATGGDGFDTEAEISYHMLASQNATGLTIGSITGIAKAGHDYLWIEFESAKDGDGRAATRPRRVHVERVLAPADFAAVFGWGGPSA